MKHEVSKLFGLPDSKVYVAYNGIDEREYNLKVNEKLRNPWRNFILELTGWKEPVDLVGFIARLEWPDVKGFKKLIEASEEVISTCPRTKFVFVCGPKRNDYPLPVEEVRKKGYVFSLKFRRDGKEFVDNLQYDRLKTMKACNLTSKNMLWINCMFNEDALNKILTFYNWKRELPSKEKPIKGIYAACDIFAFPSIYEPFGIVATEAMSFGKPVVGFEGTGISEQIRFGGGVSAIKGDVEDLASCLISVLEDEEYRKELSMGAYRNVKKRFTWSAVAKQVNRIYKKITSKK